MEVLESNLEIKLKNVNMDNIEDVKLEYLIQYNSIKAGEIKYVVNDNEVFIQLYYPLPKDMCIYVDNKLMFSQNNYEDVKKEIINMMMLNIKDKKEIIAFQKICPECKSYEIREGKGTYKKLDKYYVCTKCNIIFN